MVQRIRQSVCVDTEGRSRLSVLPTDTGNYSYWHWNIFELEVECINYYHLAVENWTKNPRAVFVVAGALSWTTLPRSHLYCSTMATSSVSTPAVSNPPGIPEDDRRFYHADAPEIPSSMAELLEQYSGIPAGEVQVEHVRRLRDRAYKEYQYPCLGLYRFLALALSSHPLYDNHVLPMLRGERDANHTTPKAPSRIFLDLGTCLGQDIRKLMFDGVPMDSVYGADILAEFVNIGYELFRDEQKLPRSHFLVPADVFDQSSPLKEFDGKVDILHANSVFHLFNWDDQVTAAIRVAKLMRPIKGSLILGSQVGHQDPGEVSSRPGRRSGTMYRHNEKSWERLWKKVGKEIGVSFAVKSSLVPHPLTKGNEEAHRGIFRITFEVWRD
jgi:hypothetical protein